MHKHLLNIQREGNLKNLSIQPTPAKIAATQLEKRTGLGVKYLSDWSLELTTTKDIDKKELYTFFSDLILKIPGIDLFIIKFNDQRLTVNIVKPVFVAKNKNLESTLNTLYDNHSGSLLKKIGEVLTTITKTYSSAKQLNYLEVERRVADVMNEGRCYSYVFQINDPGFIQKLQKQGFPEIGSDLHHFAEAIFQSHYNLPSSTDPENLFLTLLPDEVVDKIAEFLTPADKPMQNLKIAYRQRYAVLQQVSPGHIPARFTVFNKSTAPIQTNDPVESIAKTLYLRLGMKTDNPPHIQLTDKGMTLYCPTEDGARKLLAALENEQYAVSYRNTASIHDDQVYQASVTLSKLTDVEQLIECSLNQPSACTAALFQANNVALSAQFLYRGLKAIGALLKPTSSLEAFKKCKEQAIAFHLYLLKVSPEEANKFLDILEKQSKIAPIDEPLNPLQYLKAKTGWVQGVSLVVNDSDEPFFVSFAENTDTYQTIENSVKTRAKVERA